MKSSRTRVTTLSFIACSAVLLVITAWSRKHASPEGHGQKSFTLAAQGARSRVLCVVGVQVRCHFRDNLLMEALLAPGDFLRLTIIHNADWVPTPWSVRAI